MGINFQNVTFKYSKKQPTNTLNDICLNVTDQNEFIAILGHTGSGKSTLVQLMNALLIPTTGTIRVNEQIITSNERKNKSLKFKLIRKHIGLVFQFPEYQLFEDTVIKDIMFGPKNFGMNKNESESIAKEVIKILNIDDELLDRSPYSLSGGQMRRVAIAGILASNPNILILDEPTVGLDPKGKQELMDLLVKIQKDTNKTIVMISHDMNVVAKYASRIIVMKKGEMVYNGSKFELFQDVSKLSSFNLGLPECAKIALNLKSLGLLEFNQIPLTIDELEKLILTKFQVGDNYE